MIGFVTITGMCAALAQSTSTSDSGLPGDTATVAPTAISDSAGSTSDSREPTPETTTEPPPEPPPAAATNDTAAAGGAPVSAAELAGEEGGCRCASGGATAGWLLVPATLAFARRRR